MTANNLDDEDWFAGVDRITGQDGAELLDEVHAAYNKYVIFPSAEAADAVTLYTAATHGQTAWEHATRLVVKSPIKRCGKTRLQEVARELVHEPLPTTNISTAALARSIDEADPPTLILDEADTVFGKKEQRIEAAEDLRGILNSGHSRGWPYVRWDPKARQREVCSTFAMATVGGIGNMPDTIEDRAVIVTLQRRAAGERVTQWRSRRAIPALREIRDRLHAWVQLHIEELAEAEPDLPVEDRPAECWEPLAAIADAAGGDWPARARKACQALTGAVDNPDDTDGGERLLADLRMIWRDEHCLYTATIIDRLCTIEEAPWSAWHKGEKQISSRAFAALLKPYGIRTVNVREHGNGDPRKGLRHGDMLKAWERYSRYAATSDAEAPETQGREPVADADFNGATPSATPSDADDSRPVTPPVAHVARVAEERLSRATCIDCGRSIPSGVRCTDCTAIVVARARAELEEST
jgi:Protein of unknown function (DUF3631)